MTVFSKAMFLCIICAALCFAAPAAADIRNNDLAGFWRVDGKHCLYFQSHKRDNGLAYFGGLFVYKGKRIVQSATDLPCVCWSKSPGQYQCRLWITGRLVQGSFKVMGATARFQPKDSCEPQTLIRMSGMQGNVRSDSPPLAGEPPLPGCYQIEEGRLIRFERQATTGGPRYMGRPYVFTKKNGKVVVESKPEPGLAKCLRTGPHRYQCDWADPGRNSFFTLLVSQDSIITDDGKQTVTFQRIKGLQPQK